MTRSSAATRVALLACAATLACGAGGDHGGGDGGTPPQAQGGQALAVVGQGKVSGRYTAEISVRGDWAYTSTWGRIGTTYGDAIEIWNVAGATPVLRDSLIVTGAQTLGDVQVADDGRLLVVATEYAPGSIVVYSLADPARPRQLSRFSSANTLPGVHTAEVQRVGGTLYAFLSVDPNGSSGFPARLVVVDLSDPSNPREVLSRVMGSPYVHDVFIRDGILFTALWNDGLTLWDVGGGGKGGTPANPIQLGSVQTLNGDAHNVWWFHDPVTGSKRYAFVGEEGPASLLSRASGDVHVVDVSDFANPREVAFYHVDGAGTHNFSMDEAQGILYAAYYNAGVRALDVRGDLGGCGADQKDATGRCDLRRMGRELASGLTDRGPVFVWGIQREGSFVYASDMPNGLWKLNEAKR